MPQIIGIGQAVCLLLLILPSCGTPSHQLHQPLGYGEMPPGETWVAVDSPSQSPSREMVYYDPKTIHRDGDLVTLWQLIDYRTSWVHSRSLGPNTGCWRYALASSRGPMANCCAIALCPRPAICGKINQIQWPDFLPVRSSARTMS